MEVVIILFGMYISVLISAMNRLAIPEYRMCPAKVDADSNNIFMKNISRAILFLAQYW